MLFTYDDVQPRLNIDLTDPNGQALATTLIQAVQAYASSLLGFPVEADEVVEYFSEGQQRLWLNTTAPVSELTIDQYNSITRAYDEIDSLYIRHADAADVYVSTALPSGFQSVRATYTTGWTADTIPADLKDALIELVGIKLQEVTNFSSNPEDPTGDGSGVATGTLKRVQSGSLTFEYATTSNDSAWKAKAAQLSRTIGDSVPAHIVETIIEYRRPFAV